MAEAERLLLAREADRAGRGPFADEFLEGRLLVALAKRRLELESQIEVILDRRLAAAGDHDEVLDARRPGLVHRVLDDRTVDHRQHLLRNRLGRGEKPGAQTGDGEHGGTEAGGHVGISLSWEGRRGK